MKRRQFLLSGAGTAFAAPAKRPNVIVVMMDDFGVGHFAPHAAAIPTSSFDPSYVDYLRRHEVPYAPDEALRLSRRAMPTMRDLARTGTLFTNAFATSNLCAPSRTGLLMGRLQNRFGLHQNSDVEKTGMPDGRVLAAELKRAGYATGFVGKWHAGPRDATLPKEGAGQIGSVIRRSHPLSNGFDYYFGYNHFQSPFYDADNVWENWEYAGVQRRYNTELFTDRAIAFMRRAREAGQPFFAQICYHAVHGPLQPKAPDRYFDQFPSRSYELSNFYAHVNAVDAGIRAIREALGREWDNTLFVFCADNGAPVGIATPLPGNAPYAGHKGTFLQGGIRIPMLAHWPGRVPGGQRRGELVSTLDIMPTALDAADIPVPADLDGRSLLPLLAGQSTKVHDHLLWAGIHARSWGFTRETTMGEGNPERRREESPGAWVVTDGRHLLRFVTQTPAGLFKDVPNGQPAHYELYDLREDPLETRNLYAQIPQVAEPLKRVFLEQAKTLPPPTKWREDRWREMMPADNIHLGTSR